jgi:hypothetical protein
MPLGGGRRNRRFPEGPRVGRSGADLNDRRQKPLASEPGIDRDRRLSRHPVDAAAAVRSGCAVRRLGLMPLAR